MEKCERQCLETTDRHGASTPERLIGTDIGRIDAKILRLDDKRHGGGSIAILHTAEPKGATALAASSHGRIVACRGAASSHCNKDSKKKRPATRFGTGIDRISVHPAAKANGPESDPFMDGWSEVR